MNVGGWGRLVWVVPFAWGSLVGAVMGGCVGELSPTRSELELQLPRRDGFDKVADAMQPSCGTLDCHGQATRNLRLLGGRGLRLDSKESSAEGTTAPAEYDANYWAIVALEPEILSAVLRDLGNNPERMILIQKGRGTSKHKGGALMRPNNDLDQCIVEWLKGTILVDRCVSAARITSPALP